MSSYPQRPAAKSTKKANVSTYLGLMVSIGVHLALFMIVGSVVIFEGKVPPLPFMGDYLGDSASEENSVEAPPLLE
ncbi:MAG: hypothetical protein ACFCUX_03725, partial [Candidatus Methylacidiphilales bacterium]